MHHVSSDHCSAHPRLSRWLLALALGALAACATTSKAGAGADADRDGVPDAKDECPDAAEEAGGDGDGCPDAPALVLESGHITIRGKIVFPLNSAELVIADEKVLDALAKLLRESTQVKRVQIEGHTDGTGEDAFNQQLSVQRAEAVRAALLKRGIEPARLVTKGFGKGSPVAPNDSPEGRARNRRVELTVLGE